GHYRPFCRIPPAGCRITSTNPLLSVCYKPMDGFVLLTTIPTWVFHITRTKGSLFIASACHVPCRRSSMNLTTDPWIPIVWGEGQTGTVGLHEAFARGEHIRDLAVQPHERIAVMRFLICIAQAAFDGPADRDDWKVCRSKIAPTALDYLKRWQKAFELFG